MADASVRGLMKKFEEADSMATSSSPRGKKPDVAMKPVLQRFQQMKDNPSPSLSSKPGQLAPVKLTGLSDVSNMKLKARSQVKADVTNVKEDREANNISSDSNRIQAGSQNRINNDKNNNPNKSSNGDSSSSSPSNSPLSSSSLKSSQSNFTTNDNKQPFLSKFPTSSIVPKPKQASWDSQAVTANNCNNNGDENEKPLNNRTCKTEPDSSTSTNISSSSNKPSHSPVNGMFDLKSQLRPVNASSAAPPVKRVLSGVEKDPPSLSSSTGQPLNIVSQLASSSPSQVPSSLPEQSQQQTRVPPVPRHAKVEMRQRSNGIAEEVIERMSDGRKFRKLSLPSSKSATIPSKPTAPTNIDLSFIRQEYQNALNNAVRPVEEHPEEEYVDGMTVNNFTPNALPPQKQSTSCQEEKLCQRVSLIPEMTAEEEDGSLEMPVYDDTPVEDDVYMDGESERVIAPSTKLSDSSEPQSPSESEQDKKKRLKKEDKERKLKEKKEKEDEKQRKRKEEEERRMKEKFKLTGDEKLIGEGVIKQDAKASGQNLRVKKGQTITIIRLHSNPPNKWLVKADSQFGFVDASNIEVDKNIIRQAMTTQLQEDDQPTYDDVPGDSSAPSTPLAPEEGDEIYELCS